MRTIYLDSEFKCHVTNDGTMTAYETEFFDGKCDAFIEGHRIVPDEESWTNEKGDVFRGMIAPWKLDKELDAAQRAYEKELLAEYAKSLETVGVTL